MVAQPGGWAVVERDAEGVVVSGHGLRPSRRGCDRPRRGPDGRLGVMRPADTSPEAWKIQVEILRRKGPLERLLMACRMSEELHGWERASMEAREHPADRGK